LYLNCTLPIVGRGPQGTNVVHWGGRQVTVLGGGVGGETRSTKYGALAASGPS
jgi:hypothetical protein